jgi:hypothetical protein
VSSMRVEGENPLSPNLKGLEVRRLGTFWAEDTRCLLLCPIGWGASWCGSFRVRQPRPSLGTREAPRPRVVQLTPKFSSF